MSEKCIDLADRIMAATATAPNTSRASAIGDTLEWFDRNSGQVPGRTITESEWSEYVNSTNGKYLAGADLLGKAGITVVPDPEPTNAEMLESKLKAFALEVSVSEHQLELARSSAPELAAWLDEHGVRAGGDDDL